MKWMVLCAGLAMLCAACGGDEASDNGIGCVTGMSVACECTVGGPGAKTCVSPQMGYGVCDCRAAQGQSTAGTQNIAGTTAGVSAIAGTNGGTAGTDTGI